MYIFLEDKITFYAFITHRMHANTAFFTYRLDTHWTEIYI